MQLSTSLLNAILHRCLIGWIALSIFMLAGCGSDSEPEATPAVEPIATLASLSKESSTASTATPTPAPTATEVDHNAVVLASIKKQLRKSHLQMIGTVMEDDNATQMQVHYAAPDRFHFFIEPFEVIAISNKLYASVDGQWLVAPNAAKAQFASFIDEFKAIPEVKNAKLIGDEEIAKEATTLYEYDAVSKLGERAIDQHSKVWIRISDGLPVLADSTAEVDGKKQHVFFAFTYDSDVNVEEPTQVVQAANQSDTPKVSSSLKDWQPFSSAEGRFVALLPTKPTQQVNAVNTEIGSIDLYLYLSETRTGGYMVGYADYPPEVVQQVASNDMLDGARDGMVANVKGTLLKETPVTIDGYPGREVHVSVKEGAVIMRCRLYLVGNRLYELVAGSAADQAMSEEITAFLDSFQLAQ